MARRETRHRGADRVGVGFRLGRLGDLFTASDRGKVLVEDAAMQHLPFASAVVNRNPLSVSVKWPVSLSRRPMEPTQRRTWLQ